MLFAYRVTAGQEEMVSDLLYEKLKKDNPGIDAVIFSPRLKGYLIVESANEIFVRRAFSSVPHVKGIVKSKMSIVDIGDLLESKPADLDIKKGDLVKIVGGPFKGEKSKVIKINEEKDEVTVELIEVAVPIPITIKLSIIKKITDAESLRD